jgi:hypothetical protein
VTLGNNDGKATYIVWLRTGSFNAATTQSGDTMTVSESFTIKVFDPSVPP